jgi:3-methyladenine DNA glycosylase/8-oxoguanine DNA glycosylase
MRIPRIKKMHNSISREFGEPIEMEQKSVYRFPTVKELSRASEEELRSLGVGYRAEYISETVEIIRSDFDSDKLQDFEYEEAREYLKQLHGVGDKVADCVLLFSCGFHQAYPVDTWAEKALKAIYPELHSEDYNELSGNVRDYFGQNAGYAQEYLFHAARNDIIEF